MENQRLLSKIVFINVANTDYSEIGIDGNACFVGTNNLGKTTLQRAILFFYNANTRQLGIPNSKRPFEDYYFQYPNSYIVYEIMTGEGPFHIWVYRNNKICFRFVDTAYNPEYYIENNEALALKDVQHKLNQAGIHYSDQVDSFERYRNILYGADPDKKYKRFHLLKGNSQYHNIPLAITSIFLSSEKSIKAEFVKECIANSINVKNTNIEIKTVERQLRQFSERYSDIEIFYKDDNNKRSNFIRDNFGKIKALRQAQRDQAVELGKALKQGTIESERIRELIVTIRQQLEQLETVYKEQEREFNENLGGINQEIGVLKSKLKETEKKQKDYHNMNIHALLEESDKKTNYETELNARKKEYEVLTTNFKDIDLQFETLLAGIKIEEESFKNTLTSKGLNLDREFEKSKNALKEEWLAESNIIKEDFSQQLKKLEELKKAEEFKEKDLKHEEQTIRNQKYHATEISALNQQLREVKDKQTNAFAEIKSNQDKLDHIKTESNYIKEKYENALKQKNEKFQSQYTELQQQLSSVNDKLSVQQDALYGFLQSNVPGWNNTIGKICREDLLFQKDLNPSLHARESEALFGISLDLSAIKTPAKSLEEYEQEKGSIVQTIEELQQTFIEEKEKLSKDEQTEFSKLGKKTGDLKTEITRLEYELEQNTTREKTIELELKEWQHKAEENRATTLVKNDAEQKSVRALIEKFSGEITNQGKLKTEKLSELEVSYKTKTQKLSSEYTEQSNLLKEEKEAKEDDINLRRKQILDDKSKALKEKGVDSNKINILDGQIAELGKKLKTIEENASKISDYKKDKRELFDHVDTYRKEQENLEENKKQEELVFDNFKKEHKKKKATKEAIEKGELANLKNFTDGLEYFERHFKDKSIYTRLQTIVESQESGITVNTIIDLCSDIQSKEDEYHNQFNAFKGHITEYTGKFRLDNHFGFKIDNNAQDGVYERFADYLSDFYHENRIQTSIAEVAKNFAMLIDTISAKIKALNEHKGRINKIIGKMESDFSKATFENSQLIESIKLRSEDSENKILKRLQKIADFKENNSYQYGATNLFNSDSKSKNEIDKKAIELLNDLLRVINEENCEEIKVQDLFELKFRIKEGKNDTGWIERIDTVGSTGTDMLVKAIINITLLHVFIKESTDRTSENYKVHCIIDEVGQISAPYLKELISFAQERNIYLINGLPNESKLETHYNYTFKFKKENSGNVKVIPLLTISIDA